MSDQLFTVAGIIVTREGAAAKVRFTNDLARRVKLFSKGGATRTDFIELPSEMTKMEALNFMKADALFQSPEDQALIVETIAGRESMVKKVTGEVKQRKARITKKEMSLEDIAARGKRDLTAQDLLNAIRPDNVITADSTEALASDEDTSEAAE